MKIPVLLLAFSAILCSCNNRNAERTALPAGISPASETDSAGNFFPVTDYLRGEIGQIKINGITPLKRKLKDGETVDSSWVKQSDYEKEFAAFLTPVIDTANMKKIFTEKKFLDRSVDAFTFTYDPAGTLPDSINLLHWDVYADPKSGKVTRIFMRNKKNETEELQLTWQSGKWCKTVTIKNTGANPVIMSEEKIEWSFE